jgi:hypothetical protein
MVGARRYRRPGTGIQTTPGESKGRSGESKSFTQRNTRKKQGQLVFFSPTPSLGPQRAMQRTGSWFPPPSDAKFRPAATHARTQPRRLAEGARSVLPVRWGRSGSCPPSPTTRRHPAKPTRSSTGEGACHQMPGASRCPEPLVPALELD